MAQKGQARLINTTGVKLLSGVANDVVYSDGTNWFTGAFNITWATGTLATSHGGTGLSTIGTAGQLLAVNGTATGLEWVSAGGGSGTVTSVDTGDGLQGGPITTSGTVDLRLNASGGLSKVLGGGTNELGIAATGVTNAMLAGSIDLTTKVTGTLPVANGGTGLATLTSANLMVGNGTGNVTFIAPGTSGNVLTSNGSAWVSSAPASGGAPYNYCLNSQMEFNDYALTDSTSRVSNAASTHAPIRSGLDLVLHGNYFATRWWVQYAGSQTNWSRINITPGTAGVTAAYGREVWLNTANKMAIGQILNSADSALLQGRTLRVSIKVKSPSGYTNAVKIGLFQYTGTANALPDNLIPTWNGDGVEPSWAASFSRIGSAGSITASTSWQELYTEVTVPSSGANNLAMVVWSDYAMGGYLSFTEGMIQASGTTWAARSSADERRLCDFYSRRYVYADASGVESGLFVQATSTTATTGAGIVHTGMNSLSNTNGSALYNTLGYIKSSGALAFYQGNTNTASVTAWTAPTIGADSTILKPNASSGLTAGTTYRLQGSTNAPFWCVRCKEL